MYEAELKVAAFVAIHWYSCLPLLLLFPSLSPSLMLSSSGLWNVVPGNKSIALIISLYNRSTASLSECTPTVKGWRNLMWRENSSSIFLRVAFLETALFHPADASGLHCFTLSLPAFSPLTPEAPEPIKLWKSSNSAVRGCMHIYEHVGGDPGRMLDVKWDLKGGKRRRQKRGREQVDELGLIRWRFEREINLRPKESEIT